MLPGVFCWVFCCTDKLGRCLGRLSGMDAPTLRLCSVDQARVELADVMHRVAYLGDHVTIYRCGERLGVIVPVEEYERSFGSDEAFSQATGATNVD